MLNKLHTSLKDEIPSLLNNPFNWNSLVINRRKPHTYRVFTQLKNGDRVCLHRFTECDEFEAFDHPHPWPGAFIVLQGGYRMRVGLSDDRFTKPKNASLFELRAGSSYEIINPLTWHSVIPLTTTYTVIINGEPWNKDYAHTEVRTTKGKDLDRMSEKDLIDHLQKFSELIEDYNERNN